ncbi:MAG: hypothetical protein K1Y02_20505 [Candidatus Hydrogenedentes bacterium]|nr:hypothetical protein [Candidatus Hydrogenedentota bacterium]
MNARTALVCIAGVVFSLTSTALAQDPVRFKQDRFAIGFWVDPPEVTDARYAEIAEANFTLVLGGFGSTSPDVVAKQIELCQKYDLKLLAWPGNDPAESKQGPPVWGYLVRDEPNVSDFPALRERVDAIRAARPGALAYINLFPNYASKKQLGTDTYEEHVRRFIDEVRPDVLSMDHYPIFKPDSDGRDGYCETLAVMREYSQKADIPFWNFFNIMPYGPHTDPTEAQVRWQVFTSLAYGAKGVLYFCYWTPAGDEFPKGGAIIGRDGKRTRHYDEAKRVNAAVKNMGPTLMNLTSTAVVRVAPGGDAKTALAGSPLRDLIPASVDPPNDYLVGVFKHVDGRRAVLLVNYRYALSAWPTVEFDAPAEKVVEVSQENGAEVPIHDDSPDMPGVQVSLDAGAGRLFLLP